MGTGKPGEREGYSRAEENVWRCSCGGMKMEMSINEKKKKDLGLLEQTQAPGDQASAVRGAEDCGEVSGARINVQE